MRNRLYKFLFVLAVMTGSFGAAPQAFSQEYQPGDACSNAGYFTRATDLTASDGGNFMFCDGANWLGFLHYSSSGFVGINNETPATELDVIGTTKTDALFLNGVTGEPQPSYDNLLENLGDVNVPAPADGECLSWVASASKWEPGTCGGGGIGSVTGEPAPSYDNLLVNLVDVNIAAPGDGECVKYDNASSKWVSGNCAAINSVTGEPQPSFDNTLDALDDVTLTSPSNGNCLTYDGSDWVDGSCGGTAAGNTGEIQFNSGGTLGASSNLYWDVVNHRLGIGTNIPVAGIDVVGDMNYSGELTDISDRRMKKDIENLPAGQLEKILALQAVSFRMKDDAPDKAKELGFIAQDIEKVFPQLVKTGANDMKALNYIGLIAPMAQAMQEQQAQIEGLRGDLEKQQAFNEELLARIESLEKRE